MAAVDYAGIGEDVLQVILDAGRQVTLLKTGETVVDPATPWDASGSTGGASLTPTAVMDEYALRDIDGQTVRVGDQMALIAADEIPAAHDIKTFDLLVDGAETWRIKGIKPIKPGPVAVLYILQLRRE